MKEIIVVPTGLGAGEETKGEATRFFARVVEADTIWRSGGCQSGHHIMAEDGREQMFSHFGSGTFEGRKTYLKHMVINPTDLFEEAVQLEKKGIKNAFELMTIDESCISITPYHGAISRLRELVRDENKKGTIGMGVGEAIKDSRDSNLTVRAGDFGGEETKLIEKVEGIRQYKLEQATKLLNGQTNLSEEIMAELEILNDRELVQTTVDSFKYTAKLFRISGDEFLTDLITRGESLVTETSHGALLHPEYGFAPHTTQVDPTAQDVLKTLVEKEYGGKIVKVGVTRCYTTRHGAGPLVSFSEEMSKTIKETHNNEKQIWNEWLGSFRNGNFDVVATKYALGISGGPQNFGGLIISYMDELAKYDKWEVCEGYKISNDETETDNYFEMENGIILGIKKTSEINLEHQMELTRLLKKCSPLLKILEKTDDKTLEEIFIEYVEDKLKVPVVALGYGKGINDRKIRPGYEKLFR